MGEAFLVRKGGGVDASDATAIESDIISGKTAYIDDSGEAKVGTMPVVSPVVQDHIQAAQDPVYGAYSGDNPSQMYMYQRIKSDGQANTVAYAGVNWVRTEESKVANVVGLTADKITKGNTILGVTGTGSSNVFDFPLSIQDSQPTPVKSGHIWVKSSTLASKITYMSIQESLWAGTPNNSLQFVVGETAYNYIYMKETKRLTSGGNDITTENRQNNGGSQEWIVCSSTSPVVEYKLNRPMVYSTVNGVLDIETAYMWNGSAWVLLCQKGNYLAVDTGTSSMAIYNNNGNSLAYHSETKIDSRDGHFSGDGTYYASYGGVLKRTGDVFTKYFDIPRNMTLYNDSYSVSGVSISADGMTLGVTYYGYGSNGKYNYALVVYKNNGSTFNVLDTISIGIDYTGGSDMQVVTNANGTAIAVCYRNGNTGNSICIVFIDGNNCTKVNCGAPAVGGYFGAWDKINCMWLHGNQIYIKGSATGGSSKDQGIFINTLDFTNKTVAVNGRKLSMDTTSYYSPKYNHCVSTKDGGLYYVIPSSSDVVTLYYYNISNNSIYSLITARKYEYCYGVAVNLTNDRLAILGKTSSSSNNYYLDYYSLSRDDNAKTLTLTELQRLTYSNSSSGYGMSFCPH